MSKCMDCYLNSGFYHDFAPYWEHKHVDGKLVFKHDLEERVKLDIEDSIKESQYKYYGVTPFHAEGTLLAKIIEKEINHDHII